MSFQGVEVEVTVECGENHRHPIRLRYTAWNPEALEVIYNPCQEKLGPQLGEMASCMKLIHARDRHGQYTWRRNIWGKVRFEVIKNLAPISDSQAIPMLLRALRDEDPYICFMAAELLGNFSGNVGAAHKIVDILSWLTRDIINAYSYSSVQSNTWQFLLAGCAALARMGVQDPTVLARLRTIFFELALKCYSREEPPVHIVYALRAVGAVLGLTGNACDVPLLCSLRLSLHRQDAGSSLSEEPLQQLIVIQQMQQYWQNFLRR